MRDFFYMGGHGQFIWSAWGVGFIIIAGMSFIAWRQYRKTQSEIKKLKDAQNDIS